MDIPVLSVVGASGSGKTTLLEKLLPELRRRGFRVAVIKHHPQPGLVLDVPGKDTWRLARAGAESVVLAAPDLIVHRRRLEQELPLEAIAAEMGSVDLILTEGYKRESAPKIEVNRRAHYPALVARPEEVIAIASDQRFDLDVPHFGLDDVAGLADLIEARVLRQG